MEDFMGMTFHHDTLRKAFFHFSAMRKYSYNFCCIRCGHHPAILVGDANWKLSFDITNNTQTAPKNGRPK
ncbi:hypothetical protein NDU88_003983 [Pleurodeles waltl]|uniref:Uncharacterized protein n=1 Tax=Pleurodeles waltl TaxID=8319 RepID=A0AAV7QH53_PLEWA|nr:hypothetical protein NDU88_003983 [Pleurodeles waltl]